MDFRPAARLCIAPLAIGFIGAAVALILAGLASAKGFAAGALLIAIATLVSGGFYARARLGYARQVLFRLATATLLKWFVVMGGALMALIQWKVSPAAFTCGVIAGLASTLFNLRMTTTGVLKS